MNYCNHCAVSINHVTCPLCHRKVAESIDNEVKLYPDYMTMKKRRTFIAKVVAFLSITMASTCFVINLLVNADYLWSLYVVGGAVYLWVTMNHTLLSSAHTGAKIILQVISLSSVLVIMDFTSGFQRWSVNFAIPLIIIMATLLTTIIILKKRVHWRDYMGYTFVMFVIGFIPIGLYISGIATVLWTCVGTSLYALLTLIGMLLFSYKTIKEEFIRRFHV
ncbi:DUF6320 domain-containing protein [Oceanobacillus manasiensis]|uniref:DUF6320 domain-containing protein n=1 Tax=Oceanobacillus manasiensis TaxID=586413 RepID=UPI0005A5D5C1|nr:DUF6320 domain-containing protein [Oceanobacillus manasiensis]